MVAFPLRIRAVYREGKFVPVEPCPLPESEEVELTVQSPRFVPPAITDAAQRAQVMEELVARMKANPLPASAPKLTRDQLHERR
jgi:predicted DNA-binding antitoxin AbrB/MazE fold protein